MIELDHPCDRCIHAREEMVDRFHPTCDAFPEGIPYDFMNECGMLKQKECNNGIGFREEQK